MNKILKYCKYLGLFWMIIIIIAIITSLINLTDIGSTFISKLGIILAAISFFGVASFASLENNEKGYIIGLKLGLIFVLTLIIINLIVFKSSFTIDRIIYYIILIASGILGGSFGKNFKKKN